MQQQQLFRCSFSVSFQAAVASDTAQGWLLLSAFLRWDPPRFGIMPEYDLIIVRLLAAHEGLQ